MPVEMALWKMTPTGPESVTFTPLGVERRLEDMVVGNPSLMGVDLLVIGRQIRTDFGGIIDVLAVDSDAHVHVIELKRDRTPRDIVAQALDYGSWTQSLSLDQVSALYQNQHEESFDQAFAEKFSSPLPDVFNADQQLTIVASELDPASERIVNYLAERYAVPINAVFFRYFADGPSEYLARTWLLAPDKAEAGTARPVRATVRTWNGLDYYVILGNAEDTSRRWPAGRKYGFVGAGGGSWYWKPLRNLTLTHRVFAYVGGAGYVGVGQVVGPMVRLSDFDTEIDGTRTRVVDQPDIASDLRERALSDDPEVTEYAVPVQWLASRASTEAVSEPGLFASQVTACKLRDERTIQVVTSAFGLDDA